MKYPVRSLFPLLLAWLLAACATGPGSAPAAQPDAARFRELVARAYVAPFAAGDIELWLQAFADDAVALHNGRPADEGKAAIRRFGESVRESFRLEQFDVTVTAVTGSGDWVLTRGVFASNFVRRSDGVSAFGPQRGKFVLLWARQPDGAWRIVLDMGNAGQ